MSEVYEIIETKEGEYALRRAEGDEEPVLTISFSADAIEFLRDARTEVVKSMIEAGIHCVEEMVREESEQADSVADDDESQTADIVGDETVH